MRHRKHLVDPPTTIDGVFERLLEDIVSGKRAAGSRLPGERTLSRKLGVSRATLREVLRRLEEWSVIVARRGSRAIILPSREWSIDVMAAYLQFGKPPVDQPTLNEVWVDTLAMRRAIVMEIIRIAAVRIPPGGTQAARLAAAHAWSLRDDLEYAHAELDVIRKIIEAASFTPGLWLMNGLSHDASAPLRIVPRPPSDYVAMYARFFDLIDAGDATEAISLMRDYLERRDVQFIGELYRRGFSRIRSTTTRQHDAN